MTLLHQVEDRFSLSEQDLRKIMKLLEREMKIGLSEKTHDQATVNMFPTYVTSLPDGSEHGYVLSLETDLRKVMHLLEREMRIGLSEKTHDKATVNMFPTYVTSLPDGSEHGHFLSLDLGGTNLRVMLVEIMRLNNEFQNSINILHSQNFAIPVTLMSGDGQLLFDHIAERIVKFTSSFDIAEKYLPVGFTFSFPFESHGLSSAILQQWTKGFDLPNVINQDVVVLLNNALKKKSGSLNIHVVAVINDTVGCLMSCASQNKTCEIGLILGTGTNSCYLEHMRAVEIAKDKNTVKNQKNMVVVTSWGNFGANGCLDFLRTKYDIAIDSGSVHPSEDIYEKMISGMYVGELVRLILVDMILGGELFHHAHIDKITNPIFHKNQFPTSFVSIFEDDYVGDYRKARQLCTEQLGFGDGEITDNDLRTVRLVCELVSYRAAHLAAAGVAVLINRINRPYRVVVGVDGSLFQKHRYFASRMRQQIQRLIKPGLSFELRNSEDGSGIGAAVVASVAVRQSLAANRKRKYIDS